MIDYRKLVKNREWRVKISNFLGFIPDRPYLKMVYYMKTGKRLNLDNPEGFNEKLNWLKVNDIHPEYTKYVDKYEVRSIIKEKIGDGYMFPLYGVWDSYDEIDFDALPNSFVLKCTHDSGSVRIVHNKELIDHKEFRKFFSNRLKVNPFNLGREYPYKDVKPRIIAEKLMGDGKNVPLDYKFFCFHGEPVIMFVASERETDCKHTVFDMEFQRVKEIEFYVHNASAVELTKPNHFEKMKELSRILSKNIPFVRMDFYEIEGQVCFGEYTFFPAGGFYLFKPDSYEKKMGGLIHLNNNCK